MAPQIVVTVSHKARASTSAAARSYARTWDLDFVDRNNQPLDAVLGKDRAALVFTNDEVLLATAGGRLRFHLGTAFIRLKSLERGDGDPLTRAADIGSRYRVLDTTLGLGRDARVIARAVGANGHVVGVERSPALFHLASIGFARAGPEQGAAPIEVRLGDGRDVLEAQTAGSFDVVLVDPMFSEPTTSDAGFSVLRQLADPTPLTREWVREARRVAKRCVVVKAGRSQEWFGQEGLEWVPSNSNAGWYRAPGIDIS